MIRKTQRSINNVNLVVLGAMDYLTGDYSSTSKVKQVQIMIFSRL